MVAASAIGNASQSGSILQCKLAVYHFLRDHPTIHKLVMLVNQAVRAMMTAAMMTVLPFAPLTNCAIAFGFSAFYWMTVEWNNCSLKFSLPAFGGATAYHLSKAALPQIISGAAFCSLQAFGTALKGSWPLSLYAVAVTAFVNDDVNRWTSART